MDDARLAGAVTELGRLVQRKHPTAGYDVTRSEDCDEVFVNVRADVDDEFDILDPVSERRLPCRSARTCRFPSWPSPFRDWGDLTFRGVVRPRSGCCNGRQLNAVVVNRIGQIVE